MSKTIKDIAFEKAWDESHKYVLVDSGDIPLAVRTAYYNGFIAGFTYKFTGEMHEESNKN